MNHDLRNGLQIEANYARVLQNLLWANIVFGILVSIFGLLVRSPDTSIPFTSFVGFLVVVAVGLAVSTAILWLMWTYRAYDNLRRVGSRDTTMTPGWAVGWWFVPIANLWMPYKIMREINARSEISNEYELLKGTPIGIVEWWALFVIFNFVSQLSSRSENLLLELVALVLQMACYFYAIKVVGRVSALQQKMQNPVPVQPSLAQL